ncbi:MAG: methyl-accepting chemotaxis protein [Spirochaetota bacterium]|nr:methyl-accepting chemotaxis protein [Spirochaetota bacterium]
MKRKIFYVLLVFLFTALILTTASGLLVWGALGRLPSDMQDAVTEMRLVALAGSLSGAVLLLTVIGIVWIGIQRMFRPHADYILRLIEGRTGIPEILPFDAKGEMGSLTTALVRFFKDMRRFILQIKNAGMQSQEIGEDLVKQAGDIVQQTQLISETNESIQGKVKDLDQEIIDSEEAVRNMHEYIQRVNVQIEDQSTAVNESSASVEEMIASIKNIAAIAEAKGAQAEELASSAQLNENEMHKTRSVVDKVSDSTSVVLEMVEVLNDIVDQTNLLAMNAAIEAAHAGSYGHGFAVVASEIRKLAENARAQSQKMEENLKQVVNNVHSMADMSSGLEEANRRMIREIHEVADGMREMKNGTEEMSAGSDQISSALSNLVASSGQLQEVARGMREGLEVVEHSVGSLKELSRINAESTEAFGTTVANISRATGILGRLGERNERNVGTLNHYVSRFPVRGNILAENLPPYNFLENGEPGGLAVDIVRAMFLKMGRTAEIEFMRWEDAQKVAADNADIILLTVFRTEEREPQFHWIGPAFQEQVQLFSLKDRSIGSIQKIESRHDLKIGTQKGNIETEFFSGKGFREGENLLTFEDTSQLIQGLFSGKVDAVPLGKLQVVHQLTQMQRDPEKVEMVYDLKEMATDLYMTVSSRTDAGVVRTYREAFRQLKESGEYREILSRWS